MTKIEHVSNTSSTFYAINQSCWPFWTELTIKIDPARSADVGKMPWTHLCCRYASVQFSSVQSLCCVQLFATPRTAAHQASLSLPNSQSLLKLMPIELVMLSNHLILCCPLLLLPSIFASFRIFSNVLAVHIRWPKYWSFSFSFSISPSNDCSRLVSFRINCFDLLAVQKTLKNLLHHHNSEASILQHSAFFQLSHLYMTTVKTIVLTIWTFVGKMMPLLFSMPSRFVIALLRSKCLLISWLQSPSTVILEPRKRKSVTSSTFPFPICHEGMGLDTIILVFWMLSYKSAFSLSSFTFNQEAL